MVEIQDNYEREHGYIMSLTWNTEQKKHPFNIDLKILKYVCTSNLQICLSPHNIPKPPFPLL